jgi:hypothetical protein
MPETTAPACTRDECCHNCQHQIPIQCHPDNVAVGKGSLSEQLGWGCLGFVDGTEDFQVCVFSESQHGMCELYQRKDAA